MSSSKRNKFKFFDATQPLETRIEKAYNTLLMALSNIRIAKKYQQAKIKKPKKRKYIQKKEVNMFEVFNICDKCGKKIDYDEIKWHNNRIIQKEGKYGACIFREGTSGTGKKLMYSVLLCPACAKKFITFLDKFMGDAAK